jgi:hypothetical protein
MQIKSLLPLLGLVSMFPEFWVTDMTFVLNIEQWHLVMVAGVADGNCKSYTGLRVWMQRVAYQWAILQR